MTAPASYVLAGGKSSRFGSEKARAILNGTPLIVRVAQTLRSAGLDVTAVAEAADKYADLDLPTIADLRPGLGPLAGVEAALADREDRYGPGWAMLASCDLIGLQAAWVETIKGHLPPSTDATCRAVAFRSEFWEPFPAAYHTDLRPVVSELLDAGQASFQRLLTDPRTNALALPHPADWPLLVQANTRDELERFGR